MSMKNKTKKSIEQLKKEIAQAELEEAEQKIQDECPKPPLPKGYKEVTLNYTDVIIDRTNNNKNFNPKAVLEAYKINKRNSLFDMKGLKYRLISKYHPLSTVKINMELSNGEVMPFCIRLTNGGFLFDGGWYIVDEKYKYYDNNAKLWCFDYHEELCFPVNKKLNLGMLKKIIYEDDDIELETAINPKTLQKFMESTVIQKLLAGAEMEDSMRKMKMYMIVTIVVTSVTLLLTINASGLLG